MNNKRKLPNECKKMEIFRYQSLALTEFVDWIEEQGMRICEIPEVGHMPYMPIGETNEKLFARFLDIDMDKLEEEKQNILKIIKDLNKKKESV